MRSPRRMPKRRQAPASGPAASAMRRGRPRVALEVEVRPVGIGGQPLRQGGGDRGGNARRHLPRSCACGTGRSGHAPASRCRRRSPWRRSSRGESSGAAEGARRSPRRWCRRSAYGMMRRVGRGEGRVGRPLTMTVDLPASASFRGPGPPAGDDATAEPFRLVFETAPVGIAIGAPGGEIVYVNEMMCRLLGRPRDEITVGDLHRGRPPRAPPAGTGPVALPRVGSSSGPSSVRPASCTRTAPSSTRAST